MPSTCLHSSVDTWTCSDSGVDFYPVPCFKHIESPVPSFFCHWCSHVENDTLMLQKGKEYCISLLLHKLSAPQWVSSELCHRFLLEYKSKERNSMRKLQKLQKNRIRYIPSPPDSPPSGACEFTLGSPLNMFDQWCSYRWVNGQMP